MRRRGIVLAVVGLVGLATPTLPSPRGGGNVYAASPRGGGLMNAAAINSPYVADAMTTLPELDAHGDLEGEWRFRRHLLPERGLRAGLFPDRSEHPIQRRCRRQGE